MLPKKLALLLNQQYATASFLERCMMRCPIMVMNYAGLAPVPLAILAFLCLLVTKKWSLSDHFLFAWSSCEIVFFLSWRIKIREPCKRKPYAVNLSQRLAFAKHFIDHAETIHESFSQWIVERPDAPLHLDHFKPFLDCLFFDKGAQDMTYEEKEVAEEIYHAFKERIPLNPKPKKPLEKCRFINQTTDAFPAHPKSLIAYLIIQFLRNFTFYILYQLGFCRYETQKLAYWYRPGASLEPPIMYIHGLGFGYFLYLPKLFALFAAYPQRGTMLLDLPHFGMGSVDVVLGHDQFLKAFDSVIVRHDLEKVAVVGHSYGTIMASWMIRQRPQHLAHAYLVDPVCFMMWDPSMTRCVLYEDPKCMLHEWMRQFISRDPLILHTLTKELYWYESILYPEEITLPTTVFLAEDDWIVNPVAHKEYLQKKLPSHSKLVMLDTFHGGVLFHPDYISQFIASL